MPLRLVIENHTVSTAYELGWSTLKNGELLQAAEDAGFDVLLTTDTNLKYQQNLATRKISVVVLTSTSWPRIRAVADKVIAAIEMATVGSYLEVAIPYLPPSQRCKRYFCTETSRLAAEQGCWFAQRERKLDQLGGHLRLQPNKI